VTATAAAMVAEGPDRNPGSAPIHQHAPQLAVTAWRYLDQIALSLRPATVMAADTALRGLAHYLTDQG
jgi:hypothetical protein